MSYNNNRAANRPPSRYVYSSSFVKTIIYESEVEGVPPEKEQVKLEKGITEEIAFTLTADKVDDFITKFKAALDDPQGDGGVRITMYCGPKTNKETGELFDSASITIVGKFANKKGNFGKGGSFSKGNNGRRDYPQGKPEQKESPAVKPSASQIDTKTDSKYSQEPGW